MGIPDRRSVIYCIKNTKNNKKYVGSAVDCYQRWHRHKHDLKEKIHHSKKLQNSWNKNGEKSFKFFVLEFVTDVNDLIVREQYWIDGLKAFGPEGYNMTPKAGNSLGYKHTPETIAKLKANHPQKGKKQTTEFIEYRIRNTRGRKLNLSKEERERRRVFGSRPEQAQHFSTINKGVPKSEEHKAKLAEASRNAMTPERKEYMLQFNIGKKVTEETREKLSKVAKGKPKSEETKTKMSEAAKILWAKRKEAKLLKALGDA